MEGRVGGGTAPEGWKEAREAGVGGEWGWVVRSPTPCADAWRGWDLPSLCVLQGALLRASFSSRSVSLCP